MKVYLEELEEYNTNGVTTYSLVHGMESFYAEVRASGIVVLEDLDGTEMDESHPLYSKLYNTVKEHTNE